MKYLYISLVIVAGQLFSQPVFAISNSVHISAVVPQMRTVYVANAHVVRVETNSSGHVEPVFINEKTNKVVPPTSELYSQYASVVRQNDGLKTANTYYPQKSHTAAWLWDRLAKLYSPAISHLF